MRSTDSMINDLENLVKLDIDASRAYDDAIRNIDHMGIRDSLAMFKDDHDRHIARLSEAISAMGGTPPSMSPDLKGFFIEGFTSLRSMTGTEGALKAMLTNEKLTNKRYEKALESDFSEDILELIRQNREDERRHLEYIQEALTNRLWESEERRAA